MTDNPLDDFAAKAWPPPKLQRRVERSLRGTGHLASRNAGTRRFRMAAGLLLAAGLGFVVGRTSPAGGDSTPRYLLLLHEDSAYDDDRPVAQAVAEHSRWADSLRREGKLVVAEKLADERMDIGASRQLAARNETGVSTTGFFVVRAWDAAAVRAIAESSPHLRHGGRIEVRRVEETGGGKD